ncbi:N-acetyltransferase family protein [Bdellovibrio sp. HCB2-146]|uniref:GNAT family N-acetyltransferase n=1 Tax=Bdellovibrio sp. HCB2-146 TaxID=3394362 RepID=UPI0039BD0067
MEFSFRRVDFKSSTEIRFIAENDAAIPSAHDSDFPFDEQAIQDRIDYYLNKITSDDFFDVAVDSSNQVIGFHVIKRIPYMRGLFAGAVNTLWVAPAFRGRGVGRAFKVRGEEWARASGLDHLHTWIHAKNETSLLVNEKLGYEVVNVKLMKKL